ncbi:MAG TPA: flavodoxin family protein [Clostridia bacterium]|nr:flavodoxin family protein [Clostridia bacterium]
MKVILINGSPNEYGCTYTALAEIAKTLGQNGVESEIIHIGKRPIRGCQDCEVCGRDHCHCVFNDDVVNLVVERMREADGLIVGSPVYYASANGSVICLLDRAFRVGKCFAHKPAAAIASARRAGTTATMDELNKYFLHDQMPIVSSTYWPAVHGCTPEEVLKDEEGMQTMRNLARNMAWLLQSIEAAKKAGIEPPAAERNYRTDYIR